MYVTAAKEQGFLLLQTIANLSTGSHWAIAELDKRLGVRLLNRQLVCSSHQSGSALF